MADSGPRAIAFAHLYSAVCGLSVKMSARFKGKKAELAAESARRGSHHTALSALKRSPRFDSLRMSAKRASGCLLARCHRYRSGPQMARDVVSSRATQRCSSMVVIFTVVSMNRPCSGAFARAIHSRAIQRARCDLPLVLGPMSRS